MSSPSWYDLLGVEPTATPAEIKAAWRDATDKFEPGTGASQFRLFNEAADVLLNPDKRAAYDAELAGTTSLDEDSAAEPVAENDLPEAVAPAEPEPEPEPEPESEDTTEPEESPVEAEESEPVATSEDESEPAPEADAPARGRLVTVLTTSVALVVIGVLAVASLTFAAVVFAKTDLGAKADEYKAGRDAQAAALKTLPIVLSYDYRQLDDDAKLEATLATITATMTKDLGDRYRKAFTTVCSPDVDSPATAVARKTVVTTTVEDPAVIAAGTDQVRLLAFVNQQTQNINGGPNTRASQVVVTVVRSGDRWLLDTIETPNQVPPQCVDPNAEAAP